MSAFRIVEIIPSRERCAEAGWYAWDFILDTPVDEALILSLRPFGSLLYLKSLSRPFFKVESDVSLIKGLVGDNFFRLSAHDSRRDLVQEVERFLAAAPDTNRKQ
jgi:hypothetical protein